MIVPVTADPVSLDPASVLAVASAITPMTANVPIWPIPKAIALARPPLAMSSVTTTVIGTTLIAPTIAVGISLVSRSATRPNAQTAIC
jgi:hypothetical protein